MHRLHEIGIFSTNDEEGASFALQKHDCVRPICLHSTPITLGNLFVAMDGLFSVPEELSLVADVDEDGSGNDCPPLPRTFESVIGAIARIDLRGIIQRFKREYESNSTQARFDGNPRPTS